MHKSLYMKTLLLFIPLVASMMISCASTNTSYRDNLLIVVKTGNVRIEITKYRNNPMYWNDVVTKGSDLTAKDAFLNTVHSTKEVQYAAAGTIYPIQCIDGAMITVFAENNTEACIVYNGTHYYIDPKDLKGLSFIVSRQ